VFEQNGSNKLTEEIATFSFSFFAALCIIAAIKCPVAYEVVNNVVLLKLISAV
jgi:hypothetical protein